MSILLNPVRAFVQVDKRHWSSIEFISALMALRARMAHNLQELVIGSDASVNGHVLGYVQLLLPHILLERPDPSRRIFQLIGHILHVKDLQYALAVRVRVSVSAATRAAKLARNRLNRSGAPADHIHRAVKGHATRLQFGAERPARDSKQEWVDGLAKVRLNVQFDGKTLHAQRGRFPGYHSNLSSEDLDRESLTILIAQRRARRPSYHHVVC
jgi:hypothetical protein